VKLTIVSPFTEKTFDIAWLEIETPAGNFVIQPGHAPMVVTLTPHKKINIGLANGKQECLMISQGIVEISCTQITLISAD